MNTEYQSLEEHHKLPQQGATNAFVAFHNTTNGL